MFILAFMVVSFTTMSYNIAYDDIVVYYVPATHQCVVEYKGTPTYVDKDTCKYLIKEQRTR
jgi:hypothetical protein